MGWHLGLVTLHRSSKSILSKMIEINDTNKYSVGFGQIRPKNLPKCPGSFWAYIVGQDPNDSKSNRLHVGIIFRVCRFHSLEAYSCIDSSKTIGNSCELSIFDRLFLKLGQFICNEPPVLPGGHEAYKGNDLLKPVVCMINLLALHMCSSDKGLECCVTLFVRTLTLNCPSVHPPLTAREFKQASGDFWAQPAKIRPLSQLLPVFPGFDWLQTCCHSFGPAHILLLFQVPVNFFLMVMTTGQELGY